MVTAVLLTVLTGSMTVKPRREPCRIGSMDCSLDIVRPIWSPLISLAFNDLAVNTLAYTLNTEDETTNENADGLTKPRCQVDADLRQGIQHEDELQLAPQRYGVSCGPRIHRYLSLIYFLWPSRSPVQNFCSVTQ